MNNLVKFGVFVLYGYFFFWINRP